MTNKRTRNLAELLQAALDVPPEKWNEFADLECAGDAALRAELIDLLSHHQHAEDGAFLPGPVAVTNLIDHDRQSNREETQVPEDTTRRESKANNQPSQEVFGDYELLNELGRGGMGVVYKARQTKLDRIVALKMIASGQLASDTEITRFCSEAEAAAQLDHPNIVPIHDVGVHDGRHYFSMSYVEGISLNEQLKTGPLPPKEAASLVRTIAEAVHFAHDKGIVHRDLKPANVLVDINGQPRVADFGLAKRIDVEPGATKPGDVMGTPSYMPPEQAKGEVEKIGPRTDVYSLGAILYALVTGCPPFQAATVPETLDQVCNREAVSVRLLNPAVSKDLETICLKCLEKDQGRRYLSAMELAAELKRFLDGRPIHARPISRTVRIWRWCQRNPALAFAGTSLIASLLLIIGLLAGTIIYQNTRPAYVNLRVSPKDASVIVDGKRIELEDGQAFVELSPGLVELTASASGYVQEERQAKLVRGRSNAAMINIELQPNFGYLLVTSQPTEARVEVLDAKNNVVANGSTPFHSPRLRAGTYRISLTKDLFSRNNFDAVVPNGDRVAIRSNVVLKPAVQDTNSLKSMKRRIAFVSKPITGDLNFDKVALKDAVRQISKQEGIVILFITNGLRENGIRLDIPLSRRFKKGDPIGHVLSSLLTASGLTYYPASDRRLGRYLKITIPRIANNMFSTVVYPVGDLVRISPDGSPDYDRLRKVIESNTVGPWRRSDGVGGVVRALPEIGGVSILQTFRGHKEILALLKELRTSRAISAGKEKRAR